MQMGKRIAIYMMADTDTYVYIYIYIFHTCSMKFVYSQLHLPRAVNMCYSIVNSVRRCYRYVSS